MGVVGPADHLVLVGPGQGDEDGAEDLLAGDAPGLLDAGEHGRRELVAGPRAGQYRISAFVSGIVESDAFRMAKLPASQRYTDTTEGVDAAKRR